MPRRPTTTVIDVDKAADGALLMFEALEEVRRLRAKQTVTADIHAARHIISLLDDALMDLRKAGIPIPEIPDEPKV